MKRRACFCVETDRLSFTFPVFGGMMGCKSLKDRPATTAGEKGRML